MTLLASTQQRTTVGQCPKITTTDYSVPLFRKLLKLFINWLTFGKFRQLAVLFIYSSTKVLTSSVKIADLVKNMSTVPMRTNVKLARLFYKYMDEPKTAKPAEVEKDVIKKDYDEYPPYNFSWFIEGKIAAMGWPQTVENLNYLADVGIDHLITLSPEKIPPILECEKKLKWSEIRIKEFGTPTLKQIIKFIEICERAEIRGEVIGVHCRHGRGRTGTMLACYLVHFKGVAPERAVLTVRVQRPGSCETYEQEKIVCHYHDCLRGTIEKPDYRLVEDKLYFDCTMKHMSDDDEKQNGDDQDGGEQDSDKAEAKKEVEKKKKRKKSNAMVINHHIYF